MLRSVPFLAIVVIADTVIALVNGLALSTAVVSATRPSGAAWTLSFSDLLIVAGVVLLNSLIVPGCGTSVILIITALTLFDVIAIGRSEP